MWPALTALAVALAPPLAGALVGRRLARLARPAPSLVWPLALAALVGPLAVAVRLPFSIYDLVLASLTFTAGLFVGRASPRFDRRQLRGPLVSAVVLLAGAAVVEAVARRLPEPAVQLRQPGEMHFVLRDDNRDFRCGALFNPSSVPPRADRRVPRVVYVGDSMLNPLDQPRESTFFELVKQQRPESEHINLGVGGIGPDMYLSLLRQHLDGLDADEVVLFLFLGNDIFDIDRPYGCCGGGPLLGPAPGLALQCSEPAYARSYRDHWLRDPAPYSLRVFGHWSKAARLIAGAFARAQQVRPWRVTDWVGNDAQLARLRVILFAIRDEVARHHIPLRLVMIPPRWSLEGHPAVDPFAHMHASALRSAADAGIQTFDAWDTFQAAIDREPRRDWFHTEGTGNPHFGIAGHRLMADFLLTRVLPP